VIPQQYANLRWYRTALVFGPLYNESVHKDAKLDGFQSLDGTILTSTSPKLLQQLLHCWTTYCYITLKISCFVNVIYCSTFKTALKTSQVVCEQLVDCTSHRTTLKSAGVILEVYDSPLFFSFVDLLGTLFKSSFPWLLY